MDVNDIITTKEGKINFLKGLIRVAKWDAQRVPEELEYFCLVASALGLDKKEQYKIVDYWNTKEKIHVRFESLREKTLFLMVAFQLAYLDTGDFRDIEEIEIVNLATELVVSGSTLNRIEEWVKKGIEWRQGGFMDVKEIFKTEEGQINFLKGLIRIEEYEPGFSPKEMAYFHSVADALGFDQEEQDKLIAYYCNIKGELSVNFKTDKEKRLFLTTALQLSCLDIDDNTSRKEQEIIRIASELHFNLYEFNKIQEWVKEGVDWEKEGEQLLS